nr:hypothetical protein 1 [bacterium]
MGVRIKNLDTKIEQARREWRQARREQDGAKERGARDWLHYLLAKHNYAELKRKQA